MLLREYLQSTHSISRRRFTDLVDQGKIFVNGQCVVSYKQEILDDDRLKVDGLEEIVRIVASTSVIVMFNKPMWYAVSKSDSHNKTIYELLPSQFQWFYYIGRLDKNSHGLLLLTNDPKMVNEFEHPKFEIEKEYVVKIDKPVSLHDVQRMKDGIMDEWERLKIADCVLQKNCIVNLTLCEWKKRHIRRIFKSLWYKVLDLQRIREGEFSLGDLKLWERKVV